MINRLTLRAGFLLHARTKRKTESLTWLLSKTLWSELRTRTKHTNNCSTKSILSTWKNSKAQSFIPLTSFKPSRSTGQGNNSFKSICCKRSTRSERSTWKCSTNSTPQSSKPKPQHLWSNERPQTSTLEWSLVGSVRTNYSPKLDKKN